MVKSSQKRLTTTGLKPQKPARKRATGSSARSFEARLRSAIAAVDVANTLTAPLTAAIENLLHLAAQAVGSDEASVLVRDGNRGGLKFMVAIGQVADRLMKMRLPPGKGIAGFVFTTGQPMAVADVAREETFYAEVDRATGYSTQTILATPLRAGDETVGVLEIVNRLGDPPYEPFSPDDMDRAAHFADAIALLVDAHETADLIENLFKRAIKDLSNDKTPGDDLRQWLKSVRSAPEHRDLISLALSLRDIASRGEAERQMCRDILGALARWTEKRSSVAADFLKF